MNAGSASVRLHALLRAQRTAGRMPTCWQLASRNQPRYAISRELHSSQRAEGKRPVAFAFDIDGVLKQGEKVLPAAKRALQYLDQQGCQYVLCTNGGGIREADRAVKLSNELGVQVRALMSRRSRPKAAD